MGIALELSAQITKARECRAHISSGSEAVNRYRPADTSADHQRAMADALVAGNGEPAGDSALRINYQGEKPPNKSMDLSIKQ
jgi:hypothetical protein